MLDNINDRIDLNYSKNYTNEPMAIRQVKDALKNHEGQYQLIIVKKQKRFVPVIKWRKEFDFNIMTSVYKNFFTIN